MLDNKSWARSRDGEACKADIKQTLEGETLFLNMAAADPQGNVFCSSETLPGPVSLRGERAFERAIAERRFVAGTARLDPVSNQPTVTFALPILDDGSLLAVAFAAVGLHWLDSFAASQHWPPETTVTAFDAEGVVLVRYPDVENWFGRSIADTPLLRRVIASNTGVAELDGPAGERRVYAFKPFDRVSGGATGFAAIGYSPDVVFGEIEDIFRRSLLVALGAALTALVVGGFFADVLILRPVGTLLAMARRLADGDLSARTGVVRPQGELGNLEAAFDEMAAAIESRSKTIEENQDRIRQMEKMDAVGQLASGIAHDFNNLLTAINGFARLLEKKLSDLEPDGTYITEIIRAGERAAELTGQLLIFSRKKPTHSEVVDLNEIVRDMANLLGRVIGENVSLASALAPDIGRVKADPHPDRTDHSQPGHQLPRRHASWGPAHHRDRER